MTLPSQDQPRAGFSDIAELLRAVISRLESTDDGESPEWLTRLAEDDPDLKAILAAEIDRAFHL